MSGDYKLSTALYGHSLDVRSVDVTHDNSIVSGSRDKTAKFWRSNGFNPGFTDVMTYRGHTNFVSAVCSLNPSSEHTEGFIITGGNDNEICVYKLGDPFPVFSIKKHTNTVCCLTRGEQPNTFLSSSWDCTAKLWLLDDPKQPLATFTGHQAAVWSVIQLPTGNVVTGSADKDVILWEPNGKKIKVLKGHTDCVRSLTILVSKNCFISVANDAAIKLWTYTGDLINTLYGHANYIYSVCANPALGSDCFVTCGEDRTVRVWREDKNWDTISLPAQSVWSVACLSNGDIVAGSSDGLVRVFTQSADRVADTEALKQYEEEVTALTVANNQEIGGVKISDLPGREVLYEPGKKDGQTKLVREGATVVCYNWSAEAGEWQKIGDVMGGAGGTQASSGKTLFEGVEYDFVFSVDVEEGKPPIKLPYNITEDPWLSAQKFIDKNNLPQAYLEQVANFIVTNSASGQPQPTVATGSNYVDPFTGASRYTPGATNTSSNTTAGGVNLDPFTGGSSYSTASSNPLPYQRQTGPSNVNLDPFTGGNSYNTGGALAGASKAGPNPSNSYFPQDKYLTFDVGNVPAILAKIKEFNRKSGDGNASIEEGLLEGVVKLASEPSTDGVFVDLLVTLLNWPDDLVFPILDVVRLAIRNPKNNTIFSSESIGDFLMGKLKSYVCSDCAIQNNTLLSLRVLTNYFAHPNGEQLVFENRDVLLENITSLGKHRTKQIQIALTSFLLNLCIASAKRQDENGILLMGIVMPDIILNITEAEAEFRAYVALGTLLCRTAGALKEQLKSKIKNNSEFLEKLSTTSRASTATDIELKNSNCAQHVLDMIV